jgi:hypothetical protein
MLAVLQAVKLAVGATDETVGDAIEIQHFSE